MIPHWIILGDIIKEIYSKLNDFKKIFISYWNFFLFLPMAVERVIKKGVKHRSYEKTFNKLTNMMCYNILMLENFLIKINLSLPFGGTICGIYKKIRD